MTDKFLDDEFVLKLDTDDEQKLAQHRAMTMALFEAERRDEAIRHAEGRLARVSSIFKVMWEKISPGEKTSYEDRAWRLAIFYERHRPEDAPKVVNPYEHPNPVEWSKDLRPLPIPPATIEGNQMVYLFAQPEVVFRPFAMLVDKKTCDHFSLLDFLIGPNSCFVARGGALPLSAFTDAQAFSKHPVMTGLRTVSPTELIRLYVRNESSSSKLFRAAILGRVLPESDDGHTMLNARFCPK